METNDAVQELCAKFSIGEKTAKTAIEILDDLLLKCPEEFGCHDRLSWLTCLVYTVSVDARFPYGLCDAHLPQTDNRPQINVTKLVQAAQISIKRFFQQMTIIREYCFLSDAVLQTVRKLEKNYCILTVLYNKLEKILATVLVTPERATTLSEQLQLSEIRKKTDLCWSIFLVSRVSLIPSEQELCTAFTILLCCVMLIITNTEPYSLRHPYDDLCEDSAPEKEKRSRILHCLSDQFSCSLGELTQLHEHYWTEFEASLPREDEEFDLEKLHEQYVTSIDTDADVNALLFLDNDRLLYPQDLWSEQPTRDAVGGTPRTPISSVLTCVQHLDHIIKPLEDTPSETLVRYCKNCSVDPWPSMSARLEEMETRFVDEYRASVGNPRDSVCRHRFTAARKLYYHMLQLLLKLEEDKVGHTDFSKLLNHDTFHRALLACSAEIVLVSHRLTFNPLTGSPHAHTSSLSFPWVLSVAGISAYDLYKVIESFVQAEPRLTRDVVKHLQQIENDILDSIVWKEDSPLFDAIFTARAHSLPAILTAASPAKQPKPDVSTQEMFSSPRPVRPTSRPQDPGGSPLGSPVRAGGAQSAPQGVVRSTSLNLFYNKVSRLAYYRLSLLCEKLEIEKDQQRRIWTCLQHCILNKPELIRGRHLDQIMLCCVYAVCKVGNLDIKFKTIVNAYRRMDNTSPMIYKAVPISGGVYDSIIGFYNDVFLEPMKKVIMDFSPQRPAPPLSPVPAVRTASTGANSPKYRVSRGNFYVSPLKSSPFKVPLTPSKMTPRMKKLYSFGEGSSLILRSINDSMHQLKRIRFSERAAPPRSLKRLKFDTEPDTEGEEPSGDSALSRRLAQARGSPNLDGED